MSRTGESGDRTAYYHRSSRPADEQLANGFHSALALDRDKPDTKNFSDLTVTGSPVSPLRYRPSAAATSSSSSSGSTSFTPRPPATAAASRRSHSGEIPVGSADARPYQRPGHRRSGSGPVIYSGGAAATVSSTASSPSPAGLLPAGNICPSGKIGKTGMASRTTARSDVLGTGTGNYGHGSVMRGGGARSGGGEVAAAASPAKAESAVRWAMAGLDPEELRRLGNEQYRRGQFGEALRLYDRAIGLCPDNAALRGNRAAALAGLRRLGEAIKECEEAVRLDPGYFRAHQRLASLYIRLGNAEIARKHLPLAGQQLEPADLQKLNALERHLVRCSDARRIGDWKRALTECEAAIAAGADSSSLIIASRAEALLKLHQFEEADEALSSAFRLEILCPSCPQTKYLGMLSNSYLYSVRTQVDMALGRFDNAVSAAERARQIDPGSIEAVALLKKVKSVANARAEGNKLFNCGKFAEACLAYGEGLKHDPSNSVLYCNRAACTFKLGQWERSVKDCNEALKIQPNYTKALLRRAASNGKLDRWAESVQDYEILRKELPGDTEVAEALFHAQVALKISKGEEISNLKFGGAVEEVVGLEQFQAAISSPGVSVVYFMETRNHDCIRISSFVDVLCNRYPSVNFIKVDINGNLAVSDAERVRTVPTFKIYKNGARVKEMIRPDQQMLEYSMNSPIVNSEEEGDGSLMMWYMCSKMHTKREKV